MDRTKLLNDLRDRTLEIINKVHEQFAELDEETLSFKPLPNKWSIYECFEHMNIANGHYRNEFDKKLPQAVRTDADTQEIFRPGFLGNYFVRSMTPTEEGEVKSKMKTLTKFVPKSENPTADISTFINDQNYFLDVIENSRTIDLNRVKVVSAIGRIITFKLGDALRFVTGHNERHLIQAREVLALMDKSSQ